MDYQLRLRELLVIALFIACTYSVRGQRFFASVIAGYGTGTQQSAVDENTYGSSTLNSPSSYTTDVPVSLGSGFRGNINCGYRLDSSSYIEFGVHGWMSSPITSTRQIFQTEPEKTPYYFSKNTLRAHNTYLSLSYGMNFPLCKKFTWFTQVGVLGGTSVIRGTTTTDNHGYFGSSIKEYKYEYNFTTGFSFGGLARVGVKYILTKNIQLAGELFGQFMQTAVRSRDITSYTEDGVDRLHALPNSEKHIEYYNGKPTTLSSTGNTNQPLTISQGAVGFGIGMYYSF